MNTLFSNPDSDSIRDDIFDHEAPPLSEYFGFPVHALIFVLGPIAVAFLTATMGYTNNIPELFITAALLVTVTFVGLGYFVFESLMLEKISEHHATPDNPDNPDNSELSEIPSLTIYNPDFVYRGSEAKASIFHLHVVAAVDSVPGMWDTPEDLMKHIAGHSYVDRVELEESPVPPVLPVSPVSPVSLP